MRVKLLVVLAVAAGGLAVVSRRARRRTAAHAALWAEATDPVTPLPRHAG